MFDISITSCRLTNVQGMSLEKRPGFREAKIAITEVQRQSPVVFFNILVELTRVVFDLKRMATTQLAG